MILILTFLFFVFFCLLLIVFAFITFNCFLENVRRSELLKILKINCYISIKQSTFQVHPSKGHSRAVQQLRFNFHLINRVSPRKAIQIPLCSSLIHLQHLVLSTASERKSPSLSLSCSVDPLEVEHWSMPKLSVWCRCNPQVFSFTFYWSSQCVQSSIQRRILLHMHYSFIAFLVTFTWKMGQRWKITLKVIEASLLNK